MKKANWRIGTTLKKHKWYTISILLLAVLFFLWNGYTEQDLFRGQHTGSLPMTTLQGVVQKVDFPDGYYKAKVDFGYGFTEENFLGDFPSGISNGDARLVKASNTIQVSLSSISLTLTLDLQSKEGYVHSTDWDIATPLANGCEKLVGPFDLIWIDDSTLKVWLQQKCGTRIVATFWMIHGLPKGGPG